MFVPGQRWISRTEPELGLGTVLRVNGRHVEVLFAKSGILRPYAQESAPLARAEFQPGQRISGKGVSFFVERVEIHDGLLTYRGEGRELSEGQLDDEQAVSRAQDHLIGGRIDTSAHFELRRQALEHHAQARHSPAWGLASTRIDLIEHQMRVAANAFSRRAPRVLLADEVGLGKTIEAGMIVAHQLAHGRASRVLILVPDALVNQWFVEMLRRFNLAFSIFDQERCEAIEQSGTVANPFEDAQLVIAGMSLFDCNAQCAEKLFEAGWDLMVVDEAHHLEWVPDDPSPQYALVERLARVVPGVVLVTATPEQLGRRAHFARLRLLDPVRYSDLDAYVDEAAGYVELASIAETLAAGSPLNDTQRALLQQRFAQDTDLLAKLDADADAVLDALIDRHGTGRVMFRNRRASVGGFPRRIPDLRILPADGDEHDLQQHLVAEFQADIRPHPTPTLLDYANDPRLGALLELLQAHPASKFLLICRTQAKVLAIEEALRARSGIAAARFHEGLGIVQRDRQAAWFAQADGAPLLLSSEIGSEGRNFQFVQHLVLWDLPLDPDLLEQRIGRLDRIGQRGDVHIHVLAVAGSPQHVLTRWYDEGVNAFKESPADGRALLLQFGDELAALAVEHARGTQEHDQVLEALIHETRATHQMLATQLDAGRDRLLDLAANRGTAGIDLLEAIEAADNDTDTQDFILRLMDCVGVDVETTGPDTFVLDPGYMVTDALPDLANGPRQATFSRATALAREDLPLLRMDHPTVSGAVDLMLAAQVGNAAFLVDVALPPRSALLQAVFVAECVADATLDIARFLPAAPITTTVDSRLTPRPGFEPSAQALRRSGEQPLDINRYRKVLAKLVPPMLQQAKTAAHDQLTALAETAVRQAQKHLGAEIARLQALACVNTSVHESDISSAQAELATIEAEIPNARLRLDAVRFVVSADFLRLR